MKIFKAIVVSILLLFSLLAGSIVLAEEKVSLEKEGIGAGEKVIYVLATDHNGRMLWGKNFIPWLNSSFEAMERHPALKFALQTDGYTFEWLNNAPWIRALTKHLEEEYASPEDFRRLGTKLPSRQQEEMEQIIKSGKYNQMFNNFFKGDTPFLKKIKALLHQKYKGRFGLTGGGLQHPLCTVCI